MTTIEQWVQKRSGTWGQTAQEALGALRAIAELHEAELASMTPDGEDVSLICAGCSFGHKNPTLAEYCPEREAIHDALGIDGEDDTK